MTFPSVTVFEELVPDLSKLAYTEKSTPKKIEHFICSIKCAARLWIIKRSLCDENSEFYITEEELLSKQRSLYNGFRYADWIERFKDKVPDYQQKSLEEFLLKGTTKDQQIWKEKLVNRYSIDNFTLEDLLTTPIFSVDPRTMRNDFKRLTKLRQPALQEIKKESKDNSVKKKSLGEYKKTSRKAKTTVATELNLDSSSHNTGKDSLKILDVVVYQLLPKYLLSLKAAKDYLFLLIMLLTRITRSSR